MVFSWQRFWCPRDGILHLTSHGFLVDPTGPWGHLQNPTITSFTAMDPLSCLILLGEPGIGKTQTLAMEYERQETATDRFLFIDARVYSSERYFDDKVIQHPHIQAWLHETTRLHLYIDSLDEGLLRCDTLTDILLGAFGEWPLERLKLRIACRTAEWRASFEQRLRALWPDEDVDVFELAPLRQSDVRLAAQASSIDPDAFLEAVLENEVGPLASKPITLHLLLNLFRKNGALPHSQRELYDLGCLTLCEETNPLRRESGHQGQFSKIQRRDAAERLAVATILGRRFAVWHALDLGDVPSGDITLDACALSGQEPLLREALGTGLFTSRSPQEMGWSHQTFGEFLTARFMAQHLTDEQILALLYSAEDEPPRLVPQLYEVAAWAASMRPSLFDHILHTDPDVLLRSDLTVADYAGRRQLVDALLGYYERERALDDYLANHSRYSKLKHPHLAVQLRPYVGDQAKGIVPRRVAIDIASATHEVALAPDLIALVEDAAEDYGLRSHAAAALVVLDDEASCRRLAAIQQDPTDTDDELKGYALQAGWPRFIDTSTLFACMTLPKNEQFVGAYDRFLRTLNVAEIAPHDIPLALKWATAYAMLRYGRMKDLVDALLLYAWHHIMLPEVLASLAELIAVRLNHYEPLLRDTGQAIDSSRAGEGEAPLTVLIKQDAATRRAVVMAVLPLLQHTALGQLIHYVPLLLPEDLFWLIEHFEQETAAPRRTDLAQLISLRWDWRREDHLERVFWTQQHDPILAEHVAWFFAPIDPRSERAQQLREATLAEQTSTEPPRRVLPDLLPYIERGERGDMEAWWQLQEVLRYGEARIASEQACDMTTLPGWERLPIVFRLQMPDLAWQYITTTAVRQGQEIRDRLSTWMGLQTQIYRPAFAGYRAWYLLQREQPTRLASVPTEVWQAWAPMLTTYPLYGTEAQDPVHQQLIKQAYTHAPQSVITTHLAHIQQLDSEGNGLHCLHLVDGCWDDQLEAALLTQAQDLAMRPDNVLELLAYLLAHTSQSTAAWLIERIEQTEQTRLCEEMSAFAALLLAFASGEVAERLFCQLGRTDAFAREVLLRYQGARWDSPSLGERLPPGQVARWYALVVKLFPLQDDPPGPNGFVSERQKLTLWREGLLDHLQRLGSSEACLALRWLEQECPDLLHVRWALLRAQQRRRYGAWEGPDRVFRLAEDRERRYVQNGEQLVAVLVESLARLDLELQGVTPSHRLLWNIDTRQDSQTKRKRKHYWPKDESELSDFIKRHLTHDVRERGIIVNREVEIRPAEDGAGGERIDIKVDTSVSGHEGRPDHTLTVIIEVKGCWNASLKRSMETQLTHRYLHQSSCHHGIYLIGWFRCAQWKGEEDARARQTPQWTLAAARQYFKEQAASLSTPEKQITAYVLDTALR